MKDLRAHQFKLVNRAVDIADGKIKETQTLVFATPSSGKSRGIVLFAKVLLDAGIVDRVCWVCPRVSLAAQGAEVFWDEHYNPSYRARKADNTPPLIRDAATGCIAYATTYQAIAARPQVHIEEFERHRYLLVADEPHHLADEDGRTWVSSIKPLVQKATHVLATTGTLERHDGLRIPLVVRYAEKNGKKYPAPDIEYGLREAIREQAILEFKFTYQDGWAEFVHDGKIKRIEISKAAKDEESKVVATFLGRTAYRDALLRRGIDHWLSWTANVYPSRAIVICASQLMAREVREFLQDVYKLQVALAISDDLDAERTLRKFRHGKRGQVLVTVGMAYEGLDVPDCSHLICLTATRSAPWLMQAFARVSRVDYRAIRSGIEYNRQFAWVFVPDDPAMRAVVEKLRSEQIEGLKERRRVEFEKNPTDKAKNDFTPLGAQNGTVGYGTIDGRLSPDESTLVERALQKRPILSQLPPEEILGLLKDHGLRVIPIQRDAPRSDDEASLRKKNQAVATSRDHVLGLVYGATNKLAKLHFGKSVEHMGVQELRERLEWLVGLDAQDDSAGRVAQ